MEGKQYIIPENYLQDSTFLHGQIRTRPFLEGAILAIVFGIPTLFFNLDIPNHLIAFFIAGTIPFLLGYMGFNGDPLSVAAVSCWKWMRTRRLMIYNNNPRLLLERPMDAAVTSTSTRDKVADIYSLIEKRRLDNRTNMSLVEGKDFQFAYDPSIDNYTIEPDDIELTAVQKGVKHELVSIDAKSDADAGMDVMERLMASSSPVDLDTIPTVAGSLSEASESVLELDGIPAITPDLEAAHTLVIDIPDENDF